MFTDKSYPLDTIYTKPCDRVLIKTSRIVKGSFYTSVSFHTFLSLQRTLYLSKTYDISLNIIHIKEYCYT